MLAASKEYLDGDTNISEVVFCLFTKSDYDVFKILEKFYAFSFLNHVIHETTLMLSMEQLWLAFFMFEKHQKLWTGLVWELIE